MNKTDISKESLIAIQNRLTVISRKLKIFSRDELVQELMDFASVVQTIELEDDSSIDAMVKRCIDMCKPPYYMLEFPTAMSMATHLGMSYQGLMRRMAGTKYKSYTGLKKSIRNEIAEKLLTDGMEVKDVAILSGFNEVSSMIRYFKTEYGLTPSGFVKLKEQGLNNDMQKPESDL